MKVLHIFHVDPGFLTHNLVVDRHTDIFNYGRRVLVNVCMFPSTARSGCRTEQARVSGLK